MTKRRGLRPCWNVPLLVLLATSVVAATAPPERGVVRDRGGVHSSPAPASSPWARTIETSPAAEVQSPANDRVIPGFEGAATTDDGRIQVLVELADAPLAAVYAEAMKGSEPGNLTARALAASATSSQLSRIEAAQASVAAAIAAPGIDGREVYRIHNALNGIAVAVTPDRLPALRALPGVKRVLPIRAEYPTNSTSVPFIGAPKVWADTIGLPAGADGSGIRVGIIDTGIDYMHPDFGGPGATSTDYSNERTATTNFTVLVNGGTYPTTKVVGGIDLCGDAYTGSNAAVQDPNPMDCNGHGSHVAGTAAGYGMTSGNTTYNLPYDLNGPPYSSLAIGPGVAPKALLYGIRVFGCGGGTALTAQAIDWSLDPNGDSDLSDHLDVINMSLGSNFGTAVDASAVAADNAALAGEIVVISAGNSGDTFFIEGSPGSSSRAISTAATLDSEPAVVSVTVTSPLSIAGGYLGGSAAFGPVPSGQTGTAVLATDATSGFHPDFPTYACGASSTDGCCPFTNAAAMAGNICVADRGTCTFKTKAYNCQAAGGIGLIIVNNAFGTPPPGMADDANITTAITIPTEMVTMADGTTFKANFPFTATLLGASGADTVAYFSSRGPRRIYDAPLALKPDIAAPGWNITSVQTGITCTTSTGGCTGLYDPSGIEVATRNLTISGTSMACPHMTGVMALLRQLKPTWTVEELKALAMNYATHDTTMFPGGQPPTFAPPRIGAGRVDPAQSAVGNVIAMNADDTGMVSVAFQTQAMAPGPVTQTKQVRVVNHGSTPQTFTLGITNIVDSPGVAFSLPGGSSITVGAGQSALLDVRMTANPAHMDHTRDASLFPTQGVQTNFGDQPRNFLTEEASYLTFSQGSTLQFRVPLYMAERPASNMAGASTIVTGGNATGSTTIPLSGAGLCTGTLVAGPGCSGTYPTTVESLVSPFELTVVSPSAPDRSPDLADIQYAGVAYWPNVDGQGAGLAHDLLMFGMSSWGDWSTPTDVAYDICVDTNNDGVFEKIIYNTNPSIFVANSSPNDNFVRVIRTTSSTSSTILGYGSYVNVFGPDVVDSALHLNDVMVLAATPGDLGIPSTTQTIRYKIYTCPGGNPACARTTSGDRCSPSSSVYYDSATNPSPGPGYYTYTLGSQGLSFGGALLADDLNGGALPVTWNTANMTANGSLGALLLHHHNASGARAQVVPLDTAQRADLAITSSVSNPTPAMGSNVTFTFTVTNNGPNTASGITVTASSGAGFSYVSDDGSGAFNLSTGVWSVPGSLAMSASATLHVVVTVTSPLEIATLAQITASSLLDPNPSNNQASSTINAPDLADLKLTMGSTAGPVTVGSTVTYTLTLANNGDGNQPTRYPNMQGMVGDATSYSVNIADAFSGWPLLNATSFTSSDGVYNPSTHHWNLASLGNGHTASLQISVPAPNMIGNLTNNATASASTSDPNTGDNAAQAFTTVVSPANVSATKTFAPRYNNYPGGVVTYTVVLTNSSQYDQFDNPGHEFVDTLPAQVTLVSASASTGTAVADIPNNQVTWDGVVPGNNGTVTITITAQIKQGTEGQTVSNQGLVYYDADGNGSNESNAPTNDPNVGPGLNATAFAVATPVPVMTIAGIAALALLIALLGIALVGRRPLA
jgi:uncharacterized repeat protein (TIGR01451 family)